MSTLTRSEPARINFRTDAETKREAEKLFHSLGLDLSTALNMFLKQAVREQALPIHPAISRIPNQTTMMALEHTEAIITGQVDDDGATFSNARDAMTYLDSLS